MYQLFVNQKTGSRLTTTSRRTDIHKESKSRTFIGWGEEGGRGQELVKKVNSVIINKTRSIFFVKERKKETYTTHKA